MIGRQPIVMALEEQVAELLSREAIKELRYRYCLCVDEGRWDEFLELFLPEAQIRHHPSDSTYSGHEEIDEFATHLEEDHYFTVHMVHNPLLRIDGDSAEGRWEFEVVEMVADETVEWLQGCYEELYRETDTGWKFETIEVDFNYRADFYDMSQVQSMVR